MKYARSLFAIVSVAAGCHLASSVATGADFSGLDVNLGNLYRVSKAQSRSISPENFTGEKGKAGHGHRRHRQERRARPGPGLEGLPLRRIKAKTTFTLGEIKGPGCIQQIWMTPTGNWRRSILRFYWDDETEPSVECPVGDFFACGWGKYCQINSLAVCVNPGSAFNCYWQMPFRKKARITMENTDEKDMTLYYQINYTLTDVPKDAAYFHAQFRREAPLAQKGLYTILDGVKGQGQYVGTYLAWEVHSPGWWGEGEIKFFMDGDKEFPTICGTGHGGLLLRLLQLREPGDAPRENGGKRRKKQYKVFSTPYTGLAQVSRRTRSTRSASGSACTGGISPTRCALRRT